MQSMNKEAAAKRGNVKPTVIKYAFFFLLRYSLFCGADMGL
jgi:hypothetical protein